VDVDLHDAALVFVELLHSMEAKMELRMMYHYYYVETDSIDDDS